MHAPIRRVKGHSQLFSRVLRTVSVCMLDLRHIHNVANLTNLQIIVLVVVVGGSRSFLISNQNPTLYYFPYNGLQFLISYFGNYIFFDLVFLVSYF